MWGDLDVMRHLGGKASSRQESWWRLLRYRGFWPVLGYGFWAVRERQTGRFVGDVGFGGFQRATEPLIGGVPEAGWVLTTEAQGKGFASEAVAAALAWLDRDKQFRRVVCLIESGNAVSRRIAEKNGFVPAGEVEMRGAKLPLFRRDPGG